MFIDMFVGDFTWIQRQCSHQIKLPRTQRSHSERKHS